MAETIAILSAVGSQLATAATTAGGFALANAGTIGTALTAAGTIYGGITANQSAKAESKSLKRKGDQELAAAQREAMKSRRETAAIMSRQNAVAAASGGGASDDTVKAIMEKTQLQGDTNAMIDMYNGLTSRADLNQQAAVRRSEGKTGLIGSFINAGATVYGDIADRRRTAREYSTPSPAY